MKWIWFLLFLAMVGEIMDNMEYADAAKKKKKKKVTKKKKAKKAKAKRKPTTRRPGAANPNSGYNPGNSPAQIFYSPMPPGYAASDTGFGGQVAVPADTKQKPINYAMPYTSTGAAEPVAVPIVASITGQNDAKRNSWNQMVRQRRYINEDALILEHLGLVDKGKIDGFGLERSKRSFRMLKVAGTRNGLENQDSDSAAVDENNNVTEKNQKKIRRKRNLEEKLKEVHANRQENRDKMKKKQEEVKNQLNRPKRSAVTLDKDRLQEQMDKMRQAKEKLQERRNETKGTLNNRPKRDVNRERVQERLGKPQQNDNLENIKDKIQKQQQEMTEKLGRPKRETPIERVKEKLETRRERQQEKRKQKQEKQQTKRNERRQKQNAKRNQTEPTGRPQANPTFETQVMPHENTEIRLKRAIDTEVPKLQLLNPEEEEESSSSEECIGEDCSSDESCFGPDCSDDSREPAIVHNNDEIRLRRDIPNYSMPPLDAAQMKLTLPEMGYETTSPRPKRQAEIAGAGEVPTDQDSWEECIGENCSSSEECVGDDCTYEDSDESEEPPEVIAKRHAEGDGPVALLVRQKREILGRKRTGFGSPKQTDFMAGCGGNGGTDYGDYGTDDYGTDDYGGNDYAERRRRKGRRRNRNNRNNRRNRNNKKNRNKQTRNRKSKKPNRRLQSPTSMDQVNTSPYDVAAATPSGSSFAPYSPMNEAATSSGFDVMPPPPSFDASSPTIIVPQSSFSMTHALKKRQINQRETTTVPSRYTIYSIPTRTLTAGVKIEGAVNIFDHRPDNLGRKPKEGPETTRTGPVTMRPKRQVLKGRSSENQPRPPKGGKPERDQRSDPPKLHGKTLEREKREFDPMILMKSPMPPQMPLLSNTYNNSNYGILLESPTPQNTPVLKVRREAPRERPDRNPQRQRPTPKNKEGAGLMPDKSEPGSKRSDRLKRDLDPLEIMYSPPATPMLTDEEISILWNSDNWNPGFVELSLDGIPMVIPDINAENHAELPILTLDMPPEKRGYNLLPGKLVKVKREAHELRQSNQQRERSSTYRPEGDSRNSRVGEGDRQSERPPPRTNLNNRQRRPDANERPKRSPGLNFEEKSDDVQNRMMVVPSEERSLGMSNFGSHMPQFGFEPNLPIQDMEANVAIVNPLIARERREVPPRERPAPKEDGRVPRQRQRHQKEGQRIDTRTQNNLLGRGKRDLDPMIKKYSPTPMSNEARILPIPASQSVPEPGNQDNFPVPTIIHPLLFSEGVNNEADDNHRLATYNSYSLPPPSLARTGSVLAGAVKILSERDNDGELPPKYTPY